MTAPMYIYDLPVERKGKSWRVTFKLIILTFPESLSRYISRHKAANVPLPQQCSTALQQVMSVVCCKQEPGKTGFQCHYTPMTIFQIEYLLYWMVHKFCNKLICEYLPMNRRGRSIKMQGLRRTCRAIKYYGITQNRHHAPLVAANRDREKDRWKIQQAQYFLTILKSYCVGWNSEPNTLSTSQCFLFLFKFWPLHNGTAAGISPTRKDSHSSSHFLSFFCHETLHGFAANKLTSCHGKNRNPSGNLWDITNSVTSCSLDF